MATCKRMLHFAVFGLALLGFAASVSAQATTGTILGVVKDEQGGVIPGANITVKNLETNVTRTVTALDGGQFRVTNLPVGTYELTVELSGFSKYVRSGVRLAVNQDAQIDVTLQPAGVTETVTVAADSPILNTTTPEVGVRFDTTRIAELPVGNNRNIYSLALLAPGVSQLGTGQSQFSSGIQYSSNGMRTRSNNFLLDGQDGNDPSVTGAVQQLNNTDIIQEIRLITNQFAAEFGRTAGSVFNVITKSGTNALHGSAFAYHNDNSLNAQTNVEKNRAIPQPTKPPFFVDNQWGGTAGGRIIRDKLFFFGGFQRWTQRQVGAGFTLNGAPTEAGRAVLQSVATGRPQVQALLRHLPAAQAPIGQSVSFTIGAQSFTVPLGSLTGSATGTRNNTQPSARIDYSINQNHTLTGRYLNTEQFISGVGNVQVTPPGLTTQNDSNQHATNVWLTSILSNRMTNEFRVAQQHLGTNTGAADPVSLEIPSLEISELGLTGFNAATNRTAIGLAVNLPQFRFNDIYQFQNTVSYLAGNHAIKGGADIRRNYVKSFFVPTIRGLLRYPTLQAFIDDTAEAANINKPLPGGQEINYYTWWDNYFFVQDEWRATSNLSLTFGLRYELPGNTIDPSLTDINTNIVQIAGDPRFALAPIPKDDKNNWQPRVGFNWSPRTDPSGMMGMITGGDKLVVRGGWARTNDFAFLNIALNIASSFPFVAAINNSNFTNAFTRLPNLVATGLNPNLLTRTVVSEDFRAPVADQYSLEIQRALGTNLSFRIGYVGTQGNDLFQTVDGNPRLPVPLPGGGFGVSTTRQDPARGVIRLRTNSAESSYHSLQTGLDKRLSNGISAAVSYTWSKYIDTASEIFNPSSGEVAVAQDSFNREADRAVSTYDRPHRFTGNAVWELPFYRDQVGAIGRILGGWQISSSFTFQSGAPFTVLNGADPTSALGGIDGLVGNAIRPNINTDLDLSNMSIPEIIAASNGNPRSLFRLLGPNERVGNVGRNTLRADGIGVVDFGFIKNTRFNGHNIQARIEMYNATNTRNFGIPEGRANSANFLNEKGTNGGSRTVFVALRYVF